MNKLMSDITKAHLRQAIDAFCEAQDSERPDFFRVDALEDLVQFTYELAFTLGYSATHVTDRIITVDNDGAVSEVVIGPIRDGGPLHLKTKPNSQKDRA
jgi:hypothetical protein